MHQIKTCMCFLFSQPIIGCPLLRGKFCYNVHTVLQKSVHYNKYPLEKSKLYRGVSMRVWPWFC